VKEYSSTFMKRPVRLVGYAMAVCLVTLVATVYTVTSWQRAAEAHQRELESMVVMGAQGIDIYLATLEKSLAELGDELLEKGIGPSTDMRLARFARRFPEFQVIVIISPEGHALASSAMVSGHPSVDLSRTASFIDSLKHFSAGERMVLGRPIEGSMTRTWISPLRFGVRDAAGNLRFVVGAGLPQDRTHAFWKDVPLMPGGAMALVRDDLYLVARQPVPEGTPTSIFTAPFRGPLADHLIAHPKADAGFVRGASMFGESDIQIAFRRLRNFPLTFLVRDPTSNLIAQWWSSAWQTYALLLALLAGGIGIIRWTGVKQERWADEREARVAELEGLYGKLTQINFALERSNSQLSSSNAELEAFSYTVSHDLRAPLRAIDGFSMMLEGDITDTAGPEALALVTRVRSNVARMNELLSGLLDLARYSRQQLVTETLDPRAEVEAIFRELGTDAKKVRVEVGELPNGIGDRLLVREIWTNLISNAIKYSANVPSPEVRIGFEDGAYYVKDNGSGFDMAYAGQLFKMFSRLHGSTEFQGTGVGLAIVKRIVERHGGQIWADAKPNEGACFHFTLGEGQLALVG
jgi:signal transduction histidine kinase